MKLIIDISEEKYKTIQDGTYCGILDTDLYRDIKDGKPLGDELQEIRQRINQKGRDNFSLNDEYEHYLKGLTDCLDIIDTHISAWSGNENNMKDRNCENCEHHKPKTLKEGCAYAWGCEVWDCKYEPMEGKEKE